MILAPGVTQCPICNQFVYAIDDLFGVQGWVAIEEIPELETGLYHHACFQKSPYRDAFLKLDARMKNRLLDQETEYFKVLGRNDKFALAYRPVIKTYVIYFLVLGQQVEIPGSERWREFMNVIAGSVGTGHYKLRRDKDSRELSDCQLIPIEADFAQPDFARLREHLTGKGINPSSTAVQLGAVCDQLKIKPTTIGCPLERLTGTFTWPDMPADPGRPVTLTVKVEKWHTVVLTAQELRELRAFLGSVPQLQDKPKTG